MEPVGNNENVPDIIFYVEKSSHHITTLHNTSFRCFMIYDLQHHYLRISIFSHSGIFLETQITIIKKRQQQSQNMKLLFNAKHEIVQLIVRLNDMR